MAVIALIEPPIVFSDLALLFAIDREHFVRQLDPHVLLVETGKFGHHSDLVASLRHLDMRPSLSLTKSKRPDGRVREGTAQYVIE
jgi:hypothetical protein